MRTLKVDTVFSGKRLDIFVAEHLTERSRSLSEYLIDNGFVKINGSIARKGYPLRKDDIVEFNFEEGDLLKVLPDEEVEFDIVLQKKEYIVVIKGEGVKVHPLLPFERGTLLNGIVSRFPSAGNMYAKRYEGGLIHRLDTETSGLLLCALEQKYFKKLRNMFKSGNVKKYYYAVVDGVVRRGGAISAKIISPFKGAYKVYVDSSEEDTEYITFFNPVKSNKNHTLLDIELIGGKMHQIRVHLSWLGFPIVGDRLYNKDKSFRGRMMLHAYRLAIPGEFDVRCDLPHEFMQLVS